MKKVLLVLGLVMALLSFSSCEREMETIYFYRIDTFQVSESGGLNAGGVTMQYLSELDWNKTEVIENEGYDKESILKRNDGEALREFNLNVSEYNEIILFEKYKRYGVTSAHGRFTYELFREGSDEPLAEKEFTIDYSIL